MEDYLSGCWELAAKIGGRWKRTNFQTAHEAVTAFHSLVADYGRKVAEIRIINPDPAKGEALAWDNPRRRKI
jgi:hypothetical protein